jgi:anti-repressor protein
MKSPDGSNRQGLESVNVTHQGNVTMNMVPQFGADASLVPVTEGEIGGIVQPMVNARELHRWLKSGEMFSKWIKNRIKQYDFLENEDYASYWENSPKPCAPMDSDCLGNFPSKKRGRGGSNRVDYILTLDMAKELSMVENNEQGKQARRYFIRCERLILQANQSLLFQFNRAMLEFEKFKDMASDAGRTLNIVGKQYKPEALQRMNSLKSKIQPGLPLEVLS